MQLLTRQQLKENAKARLSGNWGGAIGAWVLPGIINYAISWILSTVVLGGSMSSLGMLANMTEYGSTDYEMMARMLPGLIGGYFAFMFLSIALSIFVTIPLTYGTEYWNYKLARGGAPQISDIFYFFTSGQRYKSAIFMSINVGIRVWGWSMLFIMIPYIILIVATVMESAAAVGFAVILLCAAMVGLALMIVKYNLSITQLCDNNEMITTTDAINRSINATKGHRGELLLMELSFIGWGLLCIFIIPMFYVVPYMNASMAEQSRNLSDAFYGGVPPLGGGYDPNMGAMGYNPNLPPSDYPQANPTVDQFGNPVPPNQFSGQPMNQGNVLQQPQQFSAPPQTYTTPETQGFNAAPPVAPEPPAPVVEPIINTATEVAQEVSETFRDAANAIDDEINK